MFNDRRKLVKLADPRLQGRFPMRGLYQALAVASMCIQGEAAARPLIADVVTALSYLASQAYDPAASPSSSHRPGRGVRAAEKGVEDAGAGSEKDDSPRDAMGVSKKDSAERERAVAEAKMWGSNWREKRRANEQGSFEAAGADG